MNYTEILEALHELTSRESMEFLPLAPDPRPLSAYPPISKYLLDLKNGSKPESAAEDLLDPANLQRFCEKLNFVLGVNSWDQTFSRGIVHYNYRLIDEDIFGKSYEMFLASNRKDEGIYYTPAGITGPMAGSLVNSLAGKNVDEICDAVGSKKCDFKLATPSCPRMRTRRKLAARIIDPTARLHLA